MSFDLSRPSLPYTSPHHSPLSHPFLNPIPPSHPLSPPSSSSSSSSFPSSSSSSPSRFRRPQPPSPTLHDLLYHPPGPVVPLSLAPSPVSPLPPPHPLPPPSPFQPPHTSLLQPLSPPATPFPPSTLSPHHPHPPPRPPHDVDPELYDILQMASSFDGTDEGGSEGVGRPFFQHSMPQTMGEDVLASLSPDRRVGLGGGRGSVGGAGSPFGSPMRSPGGGSHSSGPQGYRASEAAYERPPSSSPTSGGSFSSPHRSPEAFEGEATPLLSAFPHSGQSAAAGVGRERGPEAEVEALGPSRFMPLPASDPALHRRAVSSSSSSSRAALPSHALSTVPSSSSTPLLSSLPPHLSHHAYPQSTTDLHRLMQGTSPLLYSPFHLPSPFLHHDDDGEDDDEDDYAHDDSPPFHSLPSPSSPSSSSRRKRAAASSKSSPYYQSPGSTAYSRSLSVKREFEEREEEKERMELRAIEAEEEKEKEDRMEEGGGGARGEGGEGEEQEGHDEGDHHRAGKKERLNSRLARKVPTNSLSSDFRRASSLLSLILSLSVSLSLSLCLSVYRRRSWLARLASVASCMCSSWKRRRSGWRRGWTSCSGS